MRVAAASRVATFVPMPAVRGLPLLADVPDGQRRDGPPELVLGREYSVIPMPVLPRRRDEVGEKDPQAFRHGDHPLPHRYRRNDVIGEVGGRL
jgi:hypothetical protein